MGMFKKVEGENAIVCENGVYKQCDVYVRDHAIFAKTKGGFVRLYADGSTSAPRCRLDEMTWHSQNGVMQDRLGRLCTSDHHEAKSLTKTDTKLLS